MTHAQAHANWSRTPSAAQLWLGTMLRALAMLVLSVASILRMRLSLLSGECHADVEPDALPEGKSGIIMETDRAAAGSHNLWPTTIPSVRRLEGRLGSQLDSGVETDRNSDQDDWSFDRDFMRWIGFWNGIPSVHWTPRLESSCGSDSGLTLRALG